MKASAPRPALPPVFSRALGLGPGDVVSIVGCGGKTALLHRLAVENRELPVLLSTTTHIMRPPDGVVDDDVAQPPLGPGVHLCCALAGPKLGAVDPALLAAAMPADGLTLLEADGSRGLPLKGWAAHEPVIHPRTTLTVGVCTLWPTGRNYNSGEDLVHRPERYYPLTGAAQGEQVRVEHIAAMVGAPDGMFARASGRRALLINQAESPEAEALAGELAGLLPASIPTICAGSVKQGVIHVLREAQRGAGQ